MCCLSKIKKRPGASNTVPEQVYLQECFRGNQKFIKFSPHWLIRGKGKWYALGYFGINLFIITLSTIMVSRGRREPVEYVRFLLAFQIPWTLPQLLDLGEFPKWIVHLAYRIYSMIFTTTVIGLLLGWLYAPRTWCKVCPLNTLSDTYLNKKNQDKGVTDSC